MFRWLCLILALVTCALCIYYLVSNLGIVCFLQFLSDYFVNEWRTDSIFGFQPFQIIYSYKMSF